ncbi:hypothetical protein BOX37_13325 [Nocardia mangyaensis]|uniref:FAD-binding domain-containing protein n=1 Tax=Nocardia mangyaensis TaxID=2213200 RepID=A0A1J0VRT9_9NOCA|nr:NAD(P)/FAD-dependent oxidoreductase [Nocardia mangyaensis]APE34763.1 hypothetical protein BOX37_13325 [Nocardia mangyaensis]
MYDVVIVGGSLAGCSTAALLGRAGLRVAVLEAHKDPDHYKRLCTATIRAGTQPVLRRLGLADKLAEAGSMPCYDAFHSAADGWVLDETAVERGDYGYNLQRRLLDPLVRRTAAETPGVELILGAKVTDLSRDAHGRVNGVVAKIKGEETLFSGRLVIGADGRSSVVADRAGLPAIETENRRYIYFAHYRNVDMPADRTLRAWFAMPDIFLMAGFGDGTAVISCAPDKRSLPEFDLDREKFLLESFKNLPDAPDLSNVERVTDLIGTRDYPNIRRRRVVAPGLALVGDAAMVADPVSGVGCGFAFQAAEWLADAVTDALKSQDSAAIDKALARYQKQHRKRLGLHHFTIADLSKRTVLPPVIRMILAAAVDDPKIAQSYVSVVTRNSSPAVLFSPKLLVRAAIGARRARATQRREQVPALAA